ncbi:MotA/TolQ/ExbB proton channel family protein [Thermovibrio ammonificans]|uniref:MotA/TolQ/ExbB proton channel n=1 Tax=Thermovibrio ammonificans (strain DSM 15698 / JCM 12110 / HB-1) TaxID=648996 RepID=E8T2K6_THEA1|nr:MotA/TolQ/ExbB proton channel family protein [Thermovibrio ammonificans]ADU97101.1 MotA/TolQ/ExbB proton channel [Thermovibrio ammonificans HB-1]
MNFNLEVAHNLVFYILYGLFFLATAVFIERLLYFFFTFSAEKKLIRREVEEADEKSAELIYNTYTAKFDRGKGFLMFVVTGAPLLGLLGTVLGIMNSFSTMAEKGISDIAAVSKGIAFALEATALGIVVSLFALAYYHVVNALSKRGKVTVREIILKTLKVRG